MPSRDPAIGRKSVGCSETHLGLRTAQNGAIAISGRSVGLFNFKRTVLGWGLEGCSM